VRDAAGRGNGLDLVVLLETLLPIPEAYASAKQDGAGDDTFARSDLTYDHRHDRYTCPGGKELKQSHRNFAVPRSDVDQDGFIRYRASKHDCDDGSLKSRCCPGQPARKVPNP
jgi:hypothetical protein